MGYIENEQHFINYIQKAVRDSDEKTNLLSKDFYLNYIYRAGKADEFTWAIKNEGIKVLAEPDIWEWLRKERLRAFRSDGFVHQFTDEFLNMIADLEGQPGVYSFWQGENILLYVGRSINLGQRIPGSFNRFHSYDRPIYVRYIPTQSASDAVVLEAYFIVTYNPPLNGADNFGDPLTLDLQPIPDWLEPVRCNWVLHSEEVANDRQ